MKNLVYLLLIVASVQLTSCVRRTVYVSSGTTVVGPPVWAPAHGFRSQMRYYYVPDIRLYYDTFTGAYIWHDGYIWQRSMMVPAMYSGYNFRNAYAFQINYRGTTPYRDNYRHHRQYVARNSNVNNGQVNNAPRVNRGASVGAPSSGNREVNRNNAPATNRSAGNGNSVAGQGRGSAPNNSSNRIDRGTSTPNNSAPQRSAPAVNRPAPSRGGATQVKPAPSRSSGSTGGSKTAPSNSRGGARR
jgi:hypothetical protein